MLCINTLGRRIRPLSLCDQTCRAISNKNLWGSYVDEDEKKSRWMALNDKVFEPSLSGEEKRPAYVCHEKRDVWYSFKKLYIVSCLVRGLSVDEAVKQLNFASSKGAKIVKETILEAQEMAVRDHNVEFKSNLWVAESFPEKGKRLYGHRKHARGNVYKLCLQHCHYFVRLEEGTPPEHYYYYNRRKNPQELLEEWFENLRNRKITNSL